MVSVKMISKTGCPWCDKARAFLASNNIPVTETKIEDPAERQAIYDKLHLVGNARTVPQIFIIDEDGEEYRIGETLDSVQQTGGGFRAVESSGIKSLFSGPVHVSAPVAASVVVTDAENMVVAEEGHSCCE